MAALGSIGIMVANFLNVRLVGRLGSDKLMRIGAIGAGLMGVLTALVSWTDAGGLAGLVVPLFLYISCTGLIAANAITGALNLFPKVAGSVSALIGAAQFGTGILGSAFVGSFADGTPRPLGACMAFFGLVCTLSALLPVRTGTQTSTQSSEAGFIPK